MAIQKLAGGMARNTANLWKAVADAVDPTAKPAPDPTIRSTPAPAPAPVPAEGAVAEGQMLVPIDTWTRILDQVGNVHEAGQQLADARERAAKAETENHFLKEQLRDLKSQRRTVRRPASPAVADSKPSEPGPAVAAPSKRSERLTRVRRRASGWLNPE